MDEALESFSKLLTLSFLRCMIALAVFSLSVISKFSMVLVSVSDFKVGMFSS